MKKILSLFLTLLMMINFALPIQVDAAANIVPPEDFGDAIYVSEYFDEGGNKVVEKTYFVPNTSNPGISTMSTSGYGWYKNEKTTSWVSGTTTTYYAQGYFSWGNGDVSVTSATGGVSNVPKSVTISNKSTDSGTGRYALVFNKYAYVTYSFTATTIAGNVYNYDVTIRISQSGNNI